MKIVDRDQLPRSRPKPCLAGHGQPGSAPAGLKTLRLGASRAEPAPHERQSPGELIHLKKLGRIGSVGHRITGRYRGAVNRHLGIDWEFVHVCIDDASRVAFVQFMPDQRKESAVAFLEAAIATTPASASTSLKLALPTWQYCSITIHQLSPSDPKQPIGSAARPAGNATRPRRYVARHECLRPYPRINRFDHLATT